MKARIGLVATVFAVVALLGAFLPGPALASQPLKVDKRIPVPSVDVELAQRVRVTWERGKPSNPSKPPKVSSGLATGILGDSLPAGGKKYAIVIGISDYPGTANDLQYSDDDAVDMKAALTRQYGFASGNVRTLTNLAATRTAILTAIEDLATEVTDKDEVVFFYSGHGGRGRAADGDTELTDECIWSHDGKTQLVPIWDGELAAEFNAYNASRMVFIFDSCYAGGMTDLAGDGRIVAMASTENSLSYELSTIQNGEFTYYMVQLGMTSLADKNQDGKVTVEEAYDYAKPNCRYDSTTASDGFPNDLIP